MQTPNQIIIKEGAFARYSRANQPPYQSVNTNRPPSLLTSLTLHIAHTYTRCDPNFQYSNNLNPRRVLTKPSEPTNANEHWDNENSDYILFVNDILGSYSKHQYQVVDLLGQGTFGQVVKSVNIDTKETVAIKVVKNKPAYFNQGLVEIQILEMLNHQYDPENKGHIVRLTDYFVFRNHLCLVFELLSVNLFELIKQNQFRGLSMTLIRCFLIQILEAMQVLVHANVVHCDLKPENILLENLSSPAIKLIDFGSACLEDRTVYTYIQSRFYRSPEVLVGLKYSSSIDMWSLGCISAELFLGLPLFPGSSEFNQLYRIIDMLGPLPDHVLERGTKSPKYFNRATIDGHLAYSLKSEEQYAHENEIPVQPTKKYFKYKTLAEIIFNYAMKEGLSSQEIQKERDLRRAFVHFLTGLLNPDPSLRWTPDQARTHPFIKGEPFDGTFVPEPPTRSRQTQPRIIPWGIQNAALAQRPISMSYPDQMMEFQDESLSSSYSPGYVVASSPYGSSYGSSYGFAPGSAPNAFMLQHIQQQQQQQQQQMQLKAAQQKMQMGSYNNNNSGQYMQQNSPNSYMSSSLPVDNRSRQRSKSDAIKRNPNNSTGYNNSPSGPTTPRGNNSNNNNNRGYTEYGSYHDNRPAPRSSFDAAMGNYGNNNNKGKRTIDQQNKHYDNRRRGSWVPQTETRSPNQMTSPRQNTQQQQQQQQMDTEDDFMFEFEQQQPVVNNNAMDMSGSFSNLYISNNNKNEEMYNNNNTRERSNSSKHNRYQNNKKDNFYREKQPKGNT